MDEGFSQSENVGWLKISSYFFLFEKRNKKSFNDARFL
jgi:hypothetical protein